MSNNPNKIITLQELINAQVDALKLEQIMNEAPWVEITTRLGRKCYSIATIQSIIDQYEVKADIEISNLQEAINVALASGAGAAGWHASLVVDGDKNQKQINDAQLALNESLDSGEFLSGIDIPALGGNPNLAVKRVGHSIRRPKMTTKDLAFFVDPANGNDANDGLAQEKALKTFAAAINKVPYYVFHKVRIYCLDGTYDEAPIVQFMWLSASRWANFEVIGHTPENPAYTDLKPENVIFSKTLENGERQAVVWSALPGSNFNTFLKGVTIDNFWPYDVTCQVWDCIIQKGGGAFNNYAVGGHGGTVGFKQVKFKDIPLNGLICEATDFSRFHFDTCTLENVTSPIVNARNNSIVTFENCGWDLTSSTCEAGSLIMGDGATQISQFGIGMKSNTKHVVVSAGTAGAPNYNEAGMLVAYGKDYPDSNACSVDVYFGSRLKNVTSSKFVVRYADTTGSKEVFRVKNLGVVLPSIGYQMNAVPISSTAGFNNTLFVDSSDGLLKFRDNSGVVKTVSLV